MKIVQNEVLVCLPRALGDAVMAMPAMRLMDEAGSAVRLYCRSERVGRIISMLTGFEVATAEDEPDDLFVPWPVSTTWFRKLERTYPDAHMFYYDAECVAAYGAFSSNSADTIDQPRSQIEANLLVACRLLRREYSQAVWRSATRSPVHRVPSINLFAPLPAGMPDRYMVVSPGTSAPLRRWPLQHYARLSDLVRQHYDLPTVFVGHVSERPLAERINGFADTALLDGLDLSLEEQLRVLAQAQVVVANDNGSAHLSSILNAPTLVIFGPTSEKLTGALGCIEIRTEDAAFQRACGSFPCGAKNVCQFNQQRAASGLPIVTPLLRRVHSLMQRDPAATSQSTTFHEPHFAACTASITPEVLLDSIDRVMQRERLLPRAA